MPTPSQSSKKQPEQGTVHAKCRRGGDQATRGQSCDSLLAHRLSAEGASVVQLKCAKCGHVWSVPVGGSIDI